MERVKEFFIKMTAAYERSIKNDRDLFMSVLAMSTVTLLVYFLSHTIFFILASVIMTGLVVTNPKAKLTIAFLGMLVGIAIVKALGWLLL